VTSCKIMAAEAAPDTNVSRLLATLVIASVMMTAAASQRLLRVSHRRDSSLFYFSCFFIAMVVHRATPRHADLHFRNTASSWVRNRLPKPAV
jgi:hypothetical protein